MHSLRKARYMLWGKWTGGEVLLELLRSSRDRWQDAEKVRQLCSRIAQRLTVRHTVRFASSLAAASLDGHFEHPARPQPAKSLERWLVALDLVYQSLRNRHCPLRD
jgi:hypothetical protein